MPINTLKAPDAKAALKAAVEDYPRIVQKLLLFWGHPDFGAVINELTMIETARFDPAQPAGFVGRSGFPEPVMQELILLQNLHGILHPDAEADHWGVAPR